MANDSRIEEIRSTIEQALVDAFRLDRPSAKRFSHGITRELLRRFGGDKVYVPKGHKAQRDEQIREAFTGDNHDQVCQRFDISLSTLYRTIRK